MSYSGKAGVGHLHKTELILLYAAFPPIPDVGKADVGHWRREKA